MIGLDRVEVLDSPPADLEHLSGYAEQVGADITSQTTLAEARRSGDADTVRVVVLAGLTATEIPNELLAAAGAPTAPILALLTGSHDNAQTWTLTDGRLTIPGIAESLDPLRVDSDEIDVTEALLTQALDATPVAPDDPIFAEQAKDCPPQPEPRQIEVRVLGPVEIAGADRVRRTPVLGLIVYLALHRLPVDSEQLFAALWPDREHNGHMLRTRMGEARAAPQRRHRPRRTTVGPRRIHRQRLATVPGSCGRRPRRPTSRARPCPGPAVPRLRRRLAAHRRIHPDRRGGDRRPRTRCRRSTHSTDEDPVTATAAATAGLRACPYDERLYQLAMSAAAARGATGEVKALRRQLDRAMEDDIEPDDHIQPETVEVYERSMRMNRTAAG